MRQKNLRGVKVFFYVEGGSHAGLGHLRRCEALALEFLHRGAQCFFHDSGQEAVGWLTQRGWPVSSSKKNLAADVIIIDSYLINSRKIIGYKKQSDLMVGFHDFGNPNTLFDILISNVFKKPTTIGATQILAGYPYKIIHSDIVKLEPVRIRKNISHLSITLGSGGTAVAIGMKIARYLKAKFPKLSFQLIVGPFSRWKGPGVKSPSILKNPPMPDVFRMSDIIICGGGQTLFELAYLGIPGLAIVLSRDQWANVKDAAAKGYIKSVGGYSDPKLLVKIAEAVGIMYNQDVRKRASKLGRAYIDGRGAERVVSRITSALSRKSGK